mmetsp:Transcript_32221/g.55108  ORF Transcript_32221/g.55108 Transcript_32221/m.55108 type:complete len:312 (-) Transcript_32221:428-1363(-)
MSVSSVLIMDAFSLVMAICRCVASADLSRALRSSSISCCSSTACFRAAAISRRSSSTSRSRLTACVLRDSWSFLRSERSWSITLSRFCRASLFLVALCAADLCALISWSTRLSSSDSSLFSATLAELAACLSLSSPSAWLRRYLVPSSSCRAWSVCTRCELIIASSLVSLSIAVASCALRAFISAARSSSTERTSFASFSSRSRRRSSLSCSAFLDEIESLRACISCPMLTRSASFVRSSERYDAMSPRSSEICASCVSRSADSSSFSRMSSFTVFSCPTESPAPCSTSRDRFEISVLSWEMVSFARASFS